MRGEGLEHLEVLGAERLLLERAVGDQQDRLHGADRSQGDGDAVSRTVRLGAPGRPVGRAVPQQHRIRLQGGRPPGACVDRAERLRADLTGSPGDPTPRLDVARQHEQLGGRGVQQPGRLGQDAGDRLPQVRRVTGGPHEPVEQLQAGVAARQPDVDPVADHQQQDQDCEQRQRDRVDRDEGDQQQRDAGVRQGGRDARAEGLTQHARVEAGIGEADRGRHGHRRDQVRDEDGHHSGQPGAGPDRVTVCQDSGEDHRAQSGLQCEHRDVVRQLEPAQPGPHEEGETGTQDEGGDVLLGRQEGQSHHRGDLPQQETVRAAFGGQVDDEHLGHREPRHQDAPRQRRDRRLPVRQEVRGGDGDRDRRHRRRELPHPALRPSVACPC